MRVINGIDKSDIKLDVPAKLINNRMMVPLRALLEELGGKVKWNEELKCIYININS